MPPMLLLLAVQLSTPKLNMPYTSIELVVLVEKVNEPVADWLPIVLLFVFAAPLVTIIPEKGLLVPVPLEVTPVRLTDAIVLLEIVLAVPADIAVRKIPINLPVEPVRVYVPVCVLDA